MSRIEISSLTEEMEAEQEGFAVVGGNCAVQIVCLGSALGDQRIYQDGEEYETFTPYVLLVGPDDVTVAACEDCDGFLQEVYAGTIGAEPR